MELFAQVGGTDTYLTLVFNGQFNSVSTENFLSKYVPNSHYYVKMAFSPL